MKRVSNIALGVACTLLAITFAYLTVFSLRYTYTINTVSYASEHMLRTADALLPNLLYLVLFLTVIRLFARLESRLSLRLVTGLTLLLPMVAAIFWAHVSNALPRADQAYLWNTAGQLMRGQTESFTMQGSYLQRLPHQIGQLLSFEIIERIFGTDSLRPFHLLNALSLSLSYAAGLSILWQTLHNRRAQLCACLLFVLFIPGVLYSAFIYGVLPGLALTLWGFERCVSWTRRGGIWRLIAAVALLSLACLVKINNLIPALAAAIATLLLALHERKGKLAVLALCLFLVPFGASKLPAVILASRTGVSFSSGTPQTAWFVMGMQEGPRAAGWYNSYPWTLIENAGFDKAEAKRQIKADFQARLSVFTKDPAYALRFYHTKLTSEWGETTFESVWVNQAGKHGEKRPAWADSLLNSTALPQAMDGYANALYLAFAVALGWLAIRLFSRRGTAYADVYGLALLLVAVLGGFTYHLLFEAKSQYLLPYLIMMIPLAATGIAQVPPVPLRLSLRRVRALFFRRKGVL